MNKIKYENIQEVVLEENLNKYSLAVSKTFKKFKAGAVKLSEPAKKFATNMSDPAKVAKLLVRNQKMSMRKK